MKTLATFLFALGIFTITQISAQPQTLNKLSETPNDEQKADALIELSWNYILEGEWEKAKDYAEQGRQLSKKLNYEMGIAGSYMRLGIIAQYADQNYSEAEEMFLRALQIRKEAGYPLDAARVCNNLIGLFSAQSKLDSAIEFGKTGLQLLEIASTHTDDFFEVKAKLNNLLGAAYRRQGQYRKAMQHLEESLILRRNYGSKKELLKTLLNLGNLCCEEEIANYDKAEEYFREGLILARETGDIAHEAKLLLALGNVNFHQKKFAPAQNYYERLLEMNEGVENDDRIRASRNIGNIYIELEKPQKALAQWQECEKEFRKSNNSMELATIYTDMGMTYYQLSDKMKAREYLNLGLSVADSLNNGKLRIYALNGLSAFQMDQGNFRKAHLYSRESFVLQDSLAELARNALVYKTNLEQERREKADLQHNQIQLAKEKAELKSQNLIQIGILVFMGFLFLIGLIAAYAFANKKKKQLAWQEVDSLLRDQELKMIYARLDGQAAERERIARDLHDRLGGMLATVKLYFAPIETKLEHIQKESREQYNQAIALLDESCEEVRRISHDMISNSLKDFGLEYVMEEMGARIERSKQLEVNVSTFGMEERLDRLMEIQIYRIIQELIGNILKHAQAKKIEVQLNRFDDVVNIMIEDDGIGFETKSLSAKSRGLGLKNVANRVDELSGKWSIDSKPGGGTSVSVDIPCS